MKEQPPGTYVGHVFGVGAGRVAHADGNPCAAGPRGREYAHDGSRVVRGVNGDGITDLESAGIEPLGDRLGHTLRFAKADLLAGTDEKETFGA